jgi:hypothetical protein
MIMAACCQACWVQLKLNVQNIETIRNAMRQAAQWLHPNVASDLNPKQPVAGQVCPSEHTGI